MRNLLLVRYGEIFLKGQNRPLFMRALVKRIKYAVKDLGATVLLHDGRILVSDFDDLDECIRRVTKVFGVHSVCPAVEMPKDDFDALCNQAVAMMADLSGTFRVTARRSDKNYFMDSPAINIEMGHRILTANKNLSVDVKKPQHTMNVEIRDMAYLYVKVIPAVGGMPVGTNGRATLLLSGGIDSPVAGWMIAKRGVHINAVHFHSYPYTSDRAKEKVLDYHNHLHTLFCLESMNNLARNGRVNIAVAKIAGMLGIRVAGEAKGGQVAPVHKPRGLRKTTQMLVDMVKERGFRDGGYIRVAHCFAEEAAADFREALLAEFPHARFMLEPTTALCSYYAEVGGLIIGFEGAFNTHNDNRHF